MKTEFKVSFPSSPFWSIFFVQTKAWQQFSNLLGTVYRKGNLLFTPDGTCLLSPVGNRITVFDLIKYVAQNSAKMQSLKQTSSAIHPTLFHFRIGEIFPD